MYVPATTAAPKPRRSRRLVAIFVAVSAALAVCAPGVATAATRYVDDGGSADSGDCTNASAPCSTIQYAVDQAVAGDAIELAAGSFTPGAVIDKADLIVTGAGAGETIVDSSVAQPRAFDLRGGADGVTIGALTLRGPFSGIGTPDDHSGIYVGGTPGLDVAGLTLEELEITRFRFAIDVRIPGSATGWTLSSVNAHVNQYGARFWGATTDLAVSGSHFDFNTFGLYAQHPGTTPRTPGVFDGVDIGDTSFDGNASKGLYLEQGSNLDLHGLSVTSRSPPIAGMDVNPTNGIDLNVKYGDFANVRIADSVFSGATSAGVLIHGRNDAPTYSTVPATLDGVVLEHLAVTGNGAGVAFQSAVANASLTRSRIVGNAAGGVTSSVDAGPASTVEATGNWWGCNEGPTADGGNDCSTAVGDVDADPWLVLSATASPAAIATGGASSTITAAITSDSDGALAAGPFGVPAIGFSADLGSIAPTGDATAVLTSGPAAGTARVRASLDAAEAAVDVQFEEPIAALPPVTVTLPPVGVVGVVTPIAKPRIKRRGRAAIATVSCRSADGCTLSAARRTTIRIGGRTYRARVLLPARIAAGRTGVVKLRLSTRARNALRRHGSAAATVKLAVSGREPTIVTTVKARLKRRRAPLVAH
jgi:hypothetical protein